MGYEQPRVPEFQDGANVYVAIRGLIRFLKTFCLAVWKHDHNTDIRMSALEARIKKLEEGE